ncbi:MAG: amidohydrolase [Alphaproteobacteria bacterium]|nr:amidohydrolase [Alphaproteobacteria bacterium]
MIIDCHGHYTTEPKPLMDFRQRQTAAFKDKAKLPSFAEVKISDDEFRDSVSGNQLRIQKERGTNLTLFSPRASGMGHHVGDAEVSLQWSRASNDCIHRVCTLYPENFIGVCQLPQSPGVAPENCIPELERCVKELGFVGCNLNPDPSGGSWTAPPLTDRHWYKLYEKIVELDVPAMVHVSMSCNPAFHTTGAHYINADTTAFMQLITADLFKDFPTLRLIIPHGGGAVPYHWGRYRGLAQNLNRPPLHEMMKNNVFFDTCVYHQPGIDLLAKLIPADNILFASEMLGAVKGDDPTTGKPYDDTKRYVDALPLDAGDKRKIFETNALKVYPRLKQRLGVH